LQNYNAHTPQLSLEDTIRNGISNALFSLMPMGLD